MGSRLVLTTLAGISGTSLMRVLGARYLLQTRVGMDFLEVPEILVSAKGWFDSPRDVCYGVFLLRLLT